MVRLDGYENINRTFSELPAFTLLGGGKVIQPGFNLLKFSQVRN